MRALNGLLLIAFVFVLSASTVFSGGFGIPSNSCGIWKKQLPHGLHLISFPLLPENSHIDSVLSDQIPGGSTSENACKLTTLNGRGDYITAFYRTTTNDWVGEIDTLRLGVAYWLNIPEEYESVEITLVGSAFDVHDGPFGVFDTTGIYMVASPAVFPISLPASGLIESGMKADSNNPRADRIISWDNNHLKSAWFNGNIWNGFIFNMEPWKGYYLEICPTSEGFSWIYHHPEDVLDIPIIEEGARNYTPYLDVLLPDKLKSLDGGLE